MPNCSIIQRSLNWCMGTTEFPGIRSRIYYIPKSKITKWPTLPKDAKGRPTSNTYVGSFELPYNEAFSYITVYGERSQLTSEAQGELPNQTQLNKLTAVYPGVGQAPTSMAAVLNNSDCVFIAQDMAGRYRVIGSKDYLTTVRISQDLGQGTTANPSTTFAIEATDLLASPFYNGTIPTISLEGRQLNEHAADNTWTVNPTRVVVDTKDDLILVHPTNSSGNMRADLVWKTPLIFDGSDTRLIAFRLLDPRQDKAVVRMYDWCFEISGTFEDGTAFSKSANHNAYHDYIKLSDGSVVMVFDLSKLPLHPDISHDNLYGVMVSKVTIKVLNVVLWDETATIDYPYGFYWLHSFRDLDHISWYITNNDRLSIV